MIFFEKNNKTYSNNKNTSTFLFLNKKTVLFVLAAIIFTGCIIYLPGIDDLGLYRDDWNNYYNATMRGADFLREHYAADRPADGILLSGMFKIFGTNNTAYLIYNLCCRILGSTFLALTVLVIFKNFELSLFFGVFSVVFPGFLQQIEGISYVPHQTAMLSMMFSLFLTTLSFKSERIPLRYFLTFISCAFSLIGVCLMEYYIGIEAFRIAIILYFSKQKNKNTKDIIISTVLNYLPYLAAALVFVFWRTYVFSADRTGTDITEAIIEPFIAHPKHELSDFLVRMCKNIWKLLVGVWTVPVHNLLNGISMINFLAIVIPAGIAAVLCTVLSLISCKKDEKEFGYLPITLIITGIVCGSFSILPLVLSKHDINFSLSLDRFSWVGMIGPIMFAAGILYLINNKPLRYISFFFVVLASSMVQVQNKTNYINQWQSTKEYWQQLIWRAPMLAEGTTIVNGGTLLAEEDYDIFAPAAMIYYPSSIDYSPIGAEILNSDTIRQIKLGKESERETRKIFVHKDYNHLIAITKPSDNSCLRVIDGSNPVYSKDDWTKIPQIGSYSKLDQIITNHDKEVDIPFFIGEELDHGWCYYYEKIELALQMGDPMIAASYADEAFYNGYTAGDTVELFSVVKAYSLAGRDEDAEAAAEGLLRDEYMRYVGCQYFAADANAGDLIDLFCEH